MREIKFRAWDKDNKKMYKVLEIDQHLRVTLYPKGGLWHSGFEIMQFTGLLDRSGKEIYERDIIIAKWSDTKKEAFRGVIEYDVFEYKLRSKGVLYPLEKIWEPSEIIGNIYENPKLLKI